MLAKWDNTARYMIIKSVVLLGAIGLITLTYILSIGYRDTRVGQLAIGGIIALGMAILIFFRPQFGGFILIFTIYSYMSTLLTQNGLPGVNKPLLGLVLVAIIAYYLIGKQTTIPPLGRFEMIIVFYIVIQMMTFFVARDKAGVKAILIGNLKDLIIIYSLINALHERRFLKQAIWLIVIIIAMISVLGGYQTITGNYHQTFFGLSQTSLQEVVEENAEYRLGGPIARPNYWGQTLAATLPLVIYLLLQQKNWLLKGFLAGALFFIVFAIFNTYSRGAFLAMVVTVGVIAFERRARFDLIVMVIITSVIFLQVLSPTHLERLSSLSLLTGGDENTLQEDSSFKGRNAEIRAGIMMFFDSPLWGKGAGNYEANYLDYAKRIGIETRNEERQPHSLYVEILAETGLIGVILTTYLFGLLFVELGMIRQRLKKANWTAAYFNTTALQMSIISYLISSLFLHGDFIRFLWGFVALAIAAIYLFNQLLDESEMITTTPLPPASHI